MGTTSLRNEPRDLGIFITAPVNLSTNAGELAAGWVSPGLSNKSDTMFIDCLPGLLLD
jgi:hypothetical protein